MTRANNLASYAAIPPLYRNRIMNGRGRIDQRNGNVGAAIPNGASAFYAGDRWAFTKGATGAAAGACSGSAILYNVTTAFSAPAAAEVNSVYQGIEGYNVIDLGWGSANPAPVTLSFAVNSPLVGTYAVRIGNVDASRTYIATFTVTQANTWERKSITIPGCPDGTWNIGNGLGMTVWFDLGSGANFNAPAANAWNAANYTRVAGSVNFTTAVRGINFTDVQLERGSVATEYETLPYDVELARCQRYFEWVPAHMQFQATIAGQTGEQGLPFKVTKRAIPTLGALVAAPGLAQGGNNNNSQGGSRPTTDGCSFFLVSSNTGVTSYVGFRFSASAEL